MTGASLLLFAIVCVFSGVLLGLMFRL